MALERPVGSLSLAAAPQRRRYAEMGCVTVTTNVDSCLRSGRFVGHRDHDALPCPRATGSSCAGVRVGHSDTFHNGWLASRSSRPPRIYSDVRPFRSP
jgi:hypothetical protein